MLGIDFVPFYLPLSIVAGTYTLSITYKEEHIPGSPFKVKVEGESILAYTLTSKVEIKGKALTSGCKVNEVTSFEIDCQEKSIAAGLRYELYDFQLIQTLNQNVLSKTQVWIAYRNASSVYLVLKWPVQRAPKQIFN